MLNTHLKERTLRKTLTAICVLFWVFIIYYAATLSIPRERFTILVVGLGIVIYTVSEILDDNESIGQKEKSFNVKNLILLLVIIATISITAYFYYLYPVLIQERLFERYRYEYYMVFIYGVIITYLSYRAYGRAFTAVFLGSIVYVFFGPYFPGVLSHNGASVDRILNVSMLDFSGFYGNISEILAAWISLFLLYAGLLKKYGAFDMILILSQKISNIFRTGVALTAVAASAGFGTLNGASTANAALTGSFTIPTMKDAGVKKETAAGIEAVASTGGQVLPPIMGAAAFLMAAFLGTSYVSVIVAGLIPATIFAISVLFSTHFAVNGQIEDYSKKYNLKGNNRNTESVTIYKTAKFLIPFLFLIYALVIATWTISSAALATCMIMMVSALFFPLLEEVIHGGEPIHKIRSWYNKTIGGFRQGATLFAPLVVIVALINAIVDLLGATGTPARFTMVVMNLSAGTFIIALVIAMIACIILGLGMPTVAAYSIVAVLIAPALITEFGMAPIAAHYFVFYAAILSGLTPPIAVTVVVTSRISESEFWTSCLEALKIALPLFILPFSMAYNQNILTNVSIGTLIDASFIIIGSIIIAYGVNTTNDYLTQNRPTGDYLIKGIYLINGAILMFNPSLVINVSALSVFILVYLFNIHLSNRRLISTG